MAIYNYPSTVVLQPANEYNIHEKIKEANQELFLEIQMSDELPEEEIGRVQEEPRNYPNGRKVTFRPNLEEYEPDVFSASTASSASDEVIIMEEEDYVPDEQIVEEIADSLAEEVSQLTVCDPEEDVVPSETAEDVLPPIRIVTIEVPPPSPCKKYEPPVAVKLKPNPIRPKSCKPPIDPPSSVKYKSCCEGRRRENSAKLPRYMGEVSEYGLSKDQLQVKTENRLRRRRYRQESAFRRYQQEVEKIRLNEEAFARWMRLKHSKLPKNKYANRYDAAAIKQRGK